MTVPATKIRARNGMKFMASAAGVAPVPKRRRVQGGNNGSQSVPHAIASNRRREKTNHAISSHPLADLRMGTTKSLNAALLQRLRENLLSGRIMPGDKLKISVFCKQYAVSPGVVREALARLVPEGLVDFTDQRGFRAPPATATGLLDITRVRLLVEHEALIDAMRHGDEVWESEIIAAEHRLTRHETGSRDDPAAWRARHKQFHQALIAACTSPWLIRLHNMLYDQTERYRAIAASARAKPSGPKRDVVGEHRELAQAVIRRDEKKAVRLMEKHLNHTAEIVIAACM